jgi:hypothetical protein
VKATLVRGVTIAAVLIGVWMLLSVFFVAQDLFLAQTFGRGTIPLDFVAIVSLFGGLTWLMLSPFIIFLAQSNGIRPRVVLRLLAVIFGFAILRALTGAAVTPFLESRPFTMADVPRALAVQFHSNVIVISGIVAARVLYDVGRVMREKDRRALKLETQLARAQLEQLRGQLQPHFLFNAINGIAALVHTDPVRADEMLMELSALLRSTLDLGRSDTIPLRRELELVDHYLRIQTMRFQDRLHIRRTIETATLGCAVPALLLQPLLENSLRHVIAVRPQGGKMEIRATRRGDRLLLRVTDDGPGFDPAATHLGVGISNTMARLEQLYRGDARIDFTREADAFAVTIDLPAQESV